MTSLPAPSRSSSDNSPAYAGVPTHSVEACSKGDVARAYRGREIRDPHVRYRKDGSLYITDPAVLDMRAAVLAAHQKGWETRRAEAVAQAKEMRPAVGLPPT